jgi:hypothetical protein
VPEYTHLYLSSMSIILAVFSHHGIGALSDCIVSDSKKMKFGLGH